MDRPNPPPKENKLLLLYMFQKVGAMTNQQAIRFAIENQLMEYLDLQLSLAELIEAELLQSLIVDDVRYYSLTSNAQQTLEFFRTQVPHSRLEVVDENADAWRETFRKERQVTADYQKNSQGDYTVRLAVREGGVTLMGLSLNVPAKAQATQLCAHWEDRAGEAYKMLMDVLLRSDSDERGGHVK